MTEERPFSVRVYDKSFAFKAYADDYRSLTAHPRHNAISTAELTLNASSVALPHLLADGSRVVIRYRDEFLMSGQVRLKAGEFPHELSPLTFQVTSDFAILHEILGFPVPTAPAPTSLGSNAYLVGGQGADTAYFTQTDKPAETAVKTFVAANGLVRQGRAITITPTLGRGGNVTVSTRMHPLVDRLLPLVDQAGIGIDIRQDGTGFLLDVYEPTVRTRQFTAESGILRKGSWSLAAPTCNQVVVGGQGEGTDREFYMVNDPASIAVWGILEVFQDARDTNVEAELIARGRERLAEGAMKSGFSFDLGSGPGFVYGETVKVGDRVTVSPVPGAVITDVLREVTLADGDEGFRGESTVGADGDPLAAMPRAIADLRRQIRELQAGR